MERFAYLLGNGVCHQIHFHFEPCSTTDARVLLGYCLMGIGVAAAITAFFYTGSRPQAGRR